MTTQAGSNCRVAVGITAGCALIISAALLSHMRMDGCAADVHRARAAGGFNRTGNIVPVVSPSADAHEAAEEGGRLDEFASPALVAHLPPQVRHLATVTAPPGNSIQRFVHHVFVGDFDGVDLRSRLPEATLLREWRRSCQVHFKCQKFWQLGARNHRNAASRARLLCLVAAAAGTRIRSRLAACRRQRVSSVSRACLWHCSQSRVAVDGPLSPCWALVFVYAYVIGTRPTTLAPWQTHNPNWTAVFWDEPAGEALIELRYPWFLRTFKSLKGNGPRETNVMKADAMRPLVLHAFGGIYMDMDLECIRCGGNGLGLSAGALPYSAPDHMPCK